MVRTGTVSPRRAQRAPPKDSEISSVIDQALAPEPAARFTSAANMFEALAGTGFAALGTDFISKSRFVLEV